MHNSLKHLALVGTTALMCLNAHAQLVAQIWTDPIASSFNASNAAVLPTGPFAATFNPTAINFDSNTTDYTIAGFFNRPTFFNTAAGFDPTATADNVFLLLTGSFFLNAGNNSFGLAHDDGVVFSVTSLGTVLNQPGPDR